MDRFREILQKYWGYDDFRGIQREIIGSVAEGRDTLGLMPTGGGKSITFQVPAMAMEGLCLVITPLIALMKDQVYNLNKRGIRAASINMSMSRDDIITTLESCVFGGYKFLYVSPERLSSPLFLTKLSHIRVCLIAIDEAHCISQWGYDFRPSYLQLSALRDLLPSVPILALTASATPEVADDIQRQLRFPQPNVFRMSFDRPNLVYVVRQTAAMEREILHILSATSGSAIVYCRSRDGVAEYARMLGKNGVSATFYHAGLAPELRNRRQREWTSGETRVIVATNAFGMGIDKPDVRVVIHVGLPDSLEAYYQEAGRAGRDGNTSYAVLLYENHHLSRLNRRVQVAFPGRDVIAQIYEDVCCFLQIAVDDGMNVRREFDLDIFCVRFHRFPAMVLSALHLLEQSGYITLEEEAERASRLLFLLRRDELYRLREFKGKGEEILTAILRNYGGVFTDEKFISEQFVAELTGTSSHEVYEFLRMLHQRRIARYVPARQVPMLTFTRRRVDTPRVHIPREVYEDRRASYQRRIDSIIAYAQSPTCRTATILKYFGESPAGDCRHCDVCNRRHNRKSEEEIIESVKLQILARFHDTTQIPIHSLHSLPFPLDYVSRATRLLIDDDLLRLDCETLTKL